MLTNEQRKRAFNTIVVTQCLGMVTWTLFQNGFYLTYFSKLGISSATFAMLFALPFLLSGFLLLPSAFISDRVGKMKLALGGQLLLIASLFLMLAAGWCSGGLALLSVVIALVLFSLGGSLQGGSWFALLNPIIPPEVRGRFFGRLRVSFMTVSILFTLLVTRILKTTQSMSVFQVMLGLLLVAAIFRFFTYARIPELENPQGEPNHQQTFWQSCSAIFKIPALTHFNGYVFLITLFSAGVPIIFGLMQKDVFMFTPAQITLIGTLFLVGSVVGNFIGGLLVDHCGTRFVLLSVHVSYAIIMISMLARCWVPWSLLVHAGGCSLLFSLVSAAAGVAMTSEMLALIPATNKSLSTAVHASLFNLGTALSGILVSRAIGWKLFAPEWKILGYSFSDYDSLLLILAGIVLVMLAAIGLVPKIMKSDRMMPGSNYPRL